MRIWHKDLIFALPTQLLQLQWKDCCEIIRQMKTHGKVNDPLVKPVEDYPITHLYWYVRFIREEMQQRGYLPNVNNFSDWADDNWEDIGAMLSFEKVFRRWHNTRYFWQCCYCLEEKYDRGIIDRSSWKFLEIYVLSNYV